MPRNYSKEDLAIMTRDGPGAQLPEPKVRKKRKNEEGEMQRLLMHWWHQFSADKGIPECLLFAIPNGSALGYGKEEYQVRHRQIRGKLMKLEGLRPGVCDLMLAVPKINQYGATNAHGLFVELKLPKGIVSDEQKQFIHDLRNQGYKVEVCRSLDEAIKTIAEYLT
jgi:hypothetical protein